MFLYLLLVYYNNFTAIRQKKVSPSYIKRQTYKSLSAFMCCLVPSFAFLLSCKAPVLVVHFSLAAFLQHLEDTLSGARIGRRSGENGITQMVHAGKKER